MTTLHLFAGPDSYHPSRAFRDAFKGSAETIEKFYALADAALAQQPGLDWAECVAELGGQLCLLMEAKRKVIGEGLDGTWRLLGGWEWCVLVQVENQPAGVVVT